MKKTILSLLCAVCGLAANAQVYGNSHAPAYSDTPFSKRIDSFEETITVAAAEIRPRI